MFPSSDLCNLPPFISIYMICMEHSGVVAMTSETLNFPDNSSLLTGGAAFTYLKSDNWV